MVFTGSTIGLSTLVFSFSVHGMIAVLASVKVLTGRVSGLRPLFVEVVEGLSFKISLTVGTGYPIFVTLFVDLFTAGTRIVTSMFFFVTVSLLALCAVIVPRQEPGHFGDDVIMTIVVV